MITIRPACLWPPGSSYLDLGPEPRVAPEPAMQPPSTEVLGPARSCRARIVILSSPELVHGAPMPQNNSSTETHEIVLSLHSVNNVKHTKDEAYYGMATNHTAEADVPVTSEHPAKLWVGMESIVSIRVFLHSRGGNSAEDRSIGQISIPIREMLDICGPCIYYTWLLLDPWSAYGSQSRSQVADRFRRAFSEVSASLHSPRICISLTEVSVEPSQWIASEKDRAFYHDPLFVSHAQHVQTVKAYFDFCERNGSLLQRAVVRQPSHLSVEASDLQRQLEKLAAKQREEEVARLQSELDNITDEANRHIESRNSQIIKLKAEWQRLLEVEEPTIEAQRLEALERLQAARKQSVDLQKQAEGTDADMKKLRAAVQTLREEKAALMTEVQEIYSAHNTGTAPRVPAAKAEMRLLPDPKEILGDRKRL
ncbi:hypothetical protein AK812_SmicGene5716 [Symbiodinium microadriaticum]|uniref:Uncharacterized protein n=1 Tax=Symbiodinium microadriaticum TaxID=2951 RepID=A0A1Q9ET06_SYMMI|nr:hypothetical protein AK812_SmicGene5716 [Symbiodinium microadriaticum]